jgi:formate dehydrogenase major subunit/formate dehydrogenase alpha subunit
VAGLVNTFGAGAMTNSIREIRDADFLFVIGSNTSEAHPIIAMEMKRAVRNGATLVVADPRAIWMTTIADEHMQLQPGTDVWLLNAMAQVIIEEGLCAEEFIREHTEGFEAVRDAVREYTPEGAEEVCGVPADTIRRVARQYATTRKAGIYYTLGITEHSHGTDNVYALANLVLLTGHLGGPSMGLNPLRGQNNVQGANDAGASPIYYPGYQRVDDPEAQAKYETLWKRELSPRPGWNLNEMMKKAGTELRGFFVMGEDILLSEPNVLALEERMNNVEFLVLQDIFPNETMRFADVVFPAANFAEKDGVFVNSERRMQRVRKAVQPPGQARADWEILLELGRRGAASKGLDASVWQHDTSAEVFDEFAGYAPKFAGISHARLDNPPEQGFTGLQWPCPDPEHPGTKFLHKGGILRGKGLLTPVSYRPSMELPDEDYGLLLSTGRTLYHYNAATQTRRDEGLDEKQPGAFVQMHPRDARKRDIHEGDIVEVRSRRGTIQLTAHVSRQVRPGCIWMALHFAEARANVLTNDAGDAVTGTAEFKVCAAEVVKIAAGDDDHGHTFPGSYFHERPRGAAVDSASPLEEPTS